MTQSGTPFAASLACTLRNPELDNGPDIRGEIVRFFGPTDSAGGDSEEPPPESVRT